MQKIPTMFVRDETRKGHPVVDQVKPECRWVLDGEGIVTIKIDGTNVKVEGGQLFKRQKPKDRDYDAASYVPCRRDDPSDRWAWEAFDSWPVGPNGPTHSGETPPDGIYKLIGPKIQGNPHGVESHGLISVVPPSAHLRLPSAGVWSCERLREFLAANPIEGLVFHHPDGRMAKIKRRDFCLPWPVK